MGHPLPGMKASEWDCPPWDPSLAFLHLRSSHPPPPPPPPPLVQASNSLSSFATSATALASAVGPGRFRGTGRGSVDAEMITGAEEVWAKELLLASLLPPALPPFAEAGVGPPVRRVGDP